MIEASVLWTQIQNELQFATDTSFAIKVVQEMETKRDIVSWE